MKTISVITIALIVAGCAPPPIPRDLPVGPGELHTNALFEVVQRVFPKASRKTHHCLTSQGYKPFGLPADDKTIRVGTMTYIERKDEREVGGSWLMLRNRLECLAYEIAAHEAAVDRLLADGKRIYPDTVAVSDLYQTYKQGLADAFRRLAAEDAVLMHRVGELKSKLVLGKDDLRRCTVPVYDTDKGGGVRIEVFGVR